MSFMLFKLVSQHSPSTSIWAIYKSPCKLFPPGTTEPAPVFAGPAVFFLVLPLPDFLRLSTD